MIKTKIVIFEGINCSGKTTQIKMLQKYFENSVVIKSPSCELKELIPFIPEHNLSPYFINDIKRNFIKGKELINKIDYIFFDRLFDSWEVYQNEYAKYLKNPFIENIDYLNKLINKNKISLINILFDISIKEANKRILQRNRDGDKLLTSNYQSIYQTIFNKHKNRLIVDATKPLESINEILINAIEFL
jgi:thymidylate kinase